MLSSTVIRHVPLRHRTLLFAVQLSVFISCYSFFYCLLSFFNKNTDIHIFVWVVKKGLTALGVLFTQQILLFEHCIENNFIAFR